MCLIVQIKSSKGAVRVVTAKHFKMIGKIGYIKVVKTSHGEGLEPGKNVIISGISSSLMTR
jgi:hypothetical protein